jgi:hypothetical protein
MQVRLPRVFGTLVVGALATLAMSGAQAGGVNWSLSVNLPLVVASQPVYVSQPAYPVYEAPAPIYEPAPVRYYPAPVAYVQPAVMYAPAPVYEVRRRVAPMLVVQRDWHQDRHGWHGEHEHEGAPWHGDRGDHRDR